MTTPPNIEIFNETVGKTLAFLYENFPQRMSFTVSELTGIPVPSLVEEKQTRIEKYRALEMRYYSIAWLVDTGYISAKPIPYDEFHDAVLTAKGLEVLKIEPESLKAPFGDKLIEASKNSAAEVLKSTASSLLTAGATFAIKNLLNS
ncbi:hypothetical protein [Yersinia enterocolitica]|uniref:hypothetical protein n=1 Tax=Yersinia enterocolitica TaxID=630 RepID=UPI001C60FE00|nr:hypothetical protein [Yersinia enterocolitica]MBW5822349.1 hypothetical protein [Yersinia enterocolitica]